MPPTWAAALKMLHENGKSQTLPKTREEIRAASGCGSDVLTALHHMGALRQFGRDGKMYPAMNLYCPVPTPSTIREKIREMNQRRGKEFGKVIQAAQEAGIFPSPPSSAEEIKSDWAKQGVSVRISDTANTDTALAEKTYTKQEVIDRFKAFYVREYDKMDDRAYTLCGFLLESLEEAI